MNQLNDIYDPIVGRMLNPDNFYSRFIGNATSTQAYNRYSYVVNNPLKYTDPSGWIRNYITYDDILGHQSLMEGLAQVQAGMEWMMGSRSGFGGSFTYEWTYRTYISDADQKAADVSWLKYGIALSPPYTIEFYQKPIYQPSGLQLTQPFAMGTANVVAPTGDMAAMGGGVNNLNYQENQNSRPNFSTFKKNYPCSLSAGDVYKLIGGKVYQNYQSDPQKYANSCALRLSRALNYSGVKIPYIAGQTGSGSDKNWYFYRVNDLKNYLIKIWGNPDLKGDQKKLQGKTGIILFQDCGWSDATGHLDVWNGSSCEHECYFDVCGQSSLWILP